MVLLFNLIATGVPRRCRQPVRLVRCENHLMQTPSSPPEQPPRASSAQARNPLHGLTLEAIVTALVEHYGWAGLGERVPVRCFLSDPSVTSSLKFLRKTPWAREKVEGLYLFMQREVRRAGGSRASGPPDAG